MEIFAAALVKDAQRVKPENAFMVQSLVLIATGSRLRGTLSDVTGAELRALLQQHGVSPLPLLRLTSQFRRLEAC